MGIAIANVEVKMLILSFNTPVRKKETLPKFAQELAVEAEWAPSVMQQGWRYGKLESRNKLI